jgi:ubiquinone/menaquinone biosynthesis C-methylase UbiE
LRGRVCGGKLLDVGCGTGFITNLATEFFDEIHGVDITPAMIAKVPRDSGKVALHIAQAEAMPFPEACFDAVTAYSFVDHVSDQSALLREVARVLKPGGIFYADLVPNRLFWKALSPLGTNKDARFSDIVAREVAMVTENDRKVEQQFGIAPEIFRRAEPGKEDGGIDPVEFSLNAVKAGFKSCEPTFEWFLGQGAIMHGHSFGDAAVVEAYLRRAAPLTSQLFKYIYFHAVR